MCCSSGDPCPCGAAFGACSIAPCSPWILVPLHGQDQPSFCGTAACGWPSFSLPCANWSIGTSTAFGCDRLACSVAYARQAARSHGRAPAWPVCPCQAHLTFWCTQTPSLQCPASGACRAYFPCQRGLLPTDGVCCCWWPQLSCLFTPAVSSSRTATKRCCQNCGTALHTLACLAWAVGEPAAPSHVRFHSVAAALRCPSCMTGHPWTVTTPRAPAQQCVVYAPYPAPVLLATHHHHPGRRVTRATSSTAQTSSSARLPRRSAYARRGPCTNPTLPHQGLTLPSTHAMFMFADWQRSRCAGCLGPC
jgi:hypothetical protein